MVSEIRCMILFGYVMYFFFNASWCLSLCQNERISYFSFIKKNPNIADSPRRFLPSCDENGSFTAMQRNENFFFCVSIVSGKIIPNTELTHGTFGFISENVCRQYSKLWNNFLEWYHEGENEYTDLRPNGASNYTCLNGFEYHPCACSRPCIPGRNMSEVEVTCTACSPVCTCPTGYYQYNGECISADQCLILKPNVNLFDTKDFMWTTYFDAYAPNSLKRTISKPIPIEEENIDKSWIEE